MIKLVLLIHYKAGVTGKRLGNTVREQFSNVELEYYDSIGSFHKRLCQPDRHKENEIYVILADNQERLEKIVGLKKLLDGRRLVLILPGNEKKLLSLGHRLQPRYVSTETEGFEELISVLKKMADAMRACDSDK